MAETAKAKAASEELLLDEVLRVKQEAKPKVLSLRTQEGGLYLGKYGNPTELPPKAQYAGVHSGLRDVAMVLDRNLGGVVLRYLDESGTHKVLIPMSHIRQIELAE